MIDTGKEFPNITFQNITKSAGKLLIAIDGCVSSLARSRSITVADKDSFENRFDEIAQCMMNDSVAEWSSADQTRLAIMNVERAVIAGTIRFGNQIQP